MRDRAGAKRKAGGRAEARLLSLVLPVASLLVSSGIVAVPSPVQADAAPPVSAISSSPPATRADLTVLRTLVESLKDELDEANLRIDRLEQRLDQRSGAPVASPTPASQAASPRRSSDLAPPLDRLTAAEYRNALSALAERGDATSTFALPVLEGTSPDRRVASDSLAGLNIRLAAAALVGGSIVAPQGIAVAARLFDGDDDTTFTPAPTTAHATPEPRLEAARVATPSFGARIMHRLAASFQPGEPENSRGLAAVAARRQASEARTDAAPTSSSVTTPASPSEAPSLPPSALSLSYPSVSAAGDAAEAPTGYRAYMPTTRSASTVISTGPVHAKPTVAHFEQSSSGGATASLLSSNSSTQSHLRYDAASIDTSIVVPAFHHRVTVNLRTGYDRLNRLGTSSLPYYPYDPGAQGGDPATAASAGAVGASPALTVPSDIDVHRLTYGASAAVPVAHNVKVGVGYTTQRLAGTYQGTDTALVERKDAYSGSVTYTPHNGNTSVTLVGRQYRYSDDAAPEYNYKQTRGDVLFSVKF